MLEPFNFTRLNLFKNYEICNFGIIIPPINFHFLHKCYLTCFREWNLIVWYSYFKICLIVIVTPLTLNNISFNTCLNVTVSIWLDGLISSILQLAKLKTAESGISGVSIKWILYRHHHAKTPGKSPYKWQSSLIQFSLAIYENIGG